MPILVASSGPVLQVVSQYGFGGCFSGVLGSQFLRNEAFAPFDVVLAKHRRLFFAALKLYEPVTHSLVCPCGARLGTLDDANALVEQQSGTTRGISPESRVQSPKSAAAGYRCIWSWMPEIEQTQSKSVMHRAFLIRLGTPLRWGSKWIAHDNPFASAN